MDLEQLPWFVTFKQHRFTPSQRGDLVKIHLVAIPRPCKFSQKTAIIQFTCFCSVIGLLLRASCVFTGVSPSNNSTGPCYIVYNPLLTIDWFKVICKPEAQTQLIFVYLCVDGHILRMIHFIDNFNYHFIHHLFIMFYIPCCSCRYRFISNNQYVDSHLAHQYQVLQNMTSSFHHVLYSLWFPQISFYLEQSICRLTSRTLISSFTKYDYILCITKYNYHLIHHSSL